MHLWHELLTILNTVLPSRWQHYMWMHRRQLRRVKGFQADAIWRCRNMLDVDAALTCKVQQTPPSPADSITLGPTGKGCLHLLKPGAQDVVSQPGACLVSVQVFGYKTVEQYYRAAESFQYIPSIRTPCLFAVAADDPFVR